MREDHLEYRDTEKKKRSMYEELTNDCALGGGGDGGGRGSDAVRQEVRGWCAPPGAPVFKWHAGALMKQRIDDDHDDQVVAHSWLQWWRRGAASTADHHAVLSDEQVDECIEQVLRALRTRQQHAVQQLQALVHQLQRQGSFAQLCRLLEVSGASRCSNGVAMCSLTAAVCAGCYRWRCSRLFARQKCVGCAR